MQNHALKLDQLLVGGVCNYSAALNSGIAGDGGESDP